MFSCSRQGRSGLLGVRALPASCVVQETKRSFSFAHGNNQPIWWTTTMAPQNGTTCNRVHSSAHIAIHAGPTPQSARNHPSPCLQASGCVRIVECHQLGAASAAPASADFGGQVARGHGGASLAVAFVVIPHQSSTPAVTPSLGMFHCAGRPCTAHGNGSCDHTCEGALLSHQAIVTHGQIKHDNADCGEIKYKTYK